MPEPLTAEEIERIKLRLNPYMSSRDDRLNRLCDQAIQAITLAAEVERLKDELSRVELIIFDTMSNAQKMSWKEVEQNCDQACRILNKAIDREATK